jgi:hypothetical protein
MGAFTSCRVTTATRTLLRCLSETHSPDRQGSAATRDDVRTLNRLNGAETMRRITTVLTRMLDHARTRRSQAPQLLRHHRALRAHHRRAERHRGQLVRLGRGPVRLGHQVVLHDRVTRQHGPRALRLEEQRTCSTRWPAEDGANRRLRWPTLWQARTHRAQTRPDLRRWSPLSLWRLQRRRSQHSLSRRRLRRHQSFSIAY